MPQNQEGIVKKMEAVYIAIEPTEGRKVLHHKMSNIMLDLSQATTETQNYSKQNMALVITRLHKCNHVCIFHFADCELI